jgi:hypothetical protein
VPPTPPQPGITLPPEPLPPVNPPLVPPQWTHERQIQNRQGTVTNTHRYLDDPEARRYVREHVVTNPRGEMTQSWERANTGDGYQYRRSQTWTDPDGTQLRQHERTFSGSDPYNYTRERNQTLSDGRTVNHTHMRSWDGTNGMMERSFTGPNGQTHQAQRSWTPDGQIGGQMTSTPNSVQLSNISPGRAARATQPTEKVSWWQKLNPLRKRGNESAGSAATPGPRRGFTVGAPNSILGRAPSFSTGEHASSRGVQNMHRPTWAGGPSRSMRPQGRPAHANRPVTASRPSPGRRPNR